MKTYNIVCLIFLAGVLGITRPSLCSAESVPPKFSISKVNRIERMWVIPLERRDFMGSRSVNKFDYGRPVFEHERGEDYVITWRYSGPQLTEPVMLKFEYKLSKNTKDPHLKEIPYDNLKSGSYKWTFKNIGPDFQTGGKVDRWKTSIVYNGNIVAEKKSSTWHALEGT